MSASVTDLIERRRAGIEPPAPAPNPHLVLDALPLSPAGMGISRRRKRAWLAALLVVVVVGAWFWTRHGAYGLNVLLRRGGTYWVTMTPQDPRLSRGMRVALQHPVPEATPGPMHWRQLDAGFEVGELPVLAGDHQVDSILLARIDPARYRFTVRNAPAGDKGIDEWETALPKALLIVNASYYDLKGFPDTPVMREGFHLGPTSYDARGGAFVARDGHARVTDLGNVDWRSALAGGANAMVSYPLLIGDDGASHVRSRSRWLANRTFVGETRDSRIVIGTTRDAFFSLDRLAHFLMLAPLDLERALNLDGGPIACQSIRFPGFHRKFYAQWEAQVEGEEVKLLRWPFKSATWAMPMVLAVERL